MHHALKRTISNNFYLLWLIRPWLKLRTHINETGTETTIKSISTITIQMNSWLVYIHTKKCYNNNNKKRGWI